MWLALVAVSVLPAATHAFTGRGTSIHLDFGDVPAALLTDARTLGWVAVVLALAAPVLAGSLEVAARVGATPSMVVIVMVER